ncbi:glycosyltransferase [Mangrovitalea sediminis]|uniref:glycosyltransferase n=1 Tax=Mangrovitalea sediminis TaxID=1982043 RepID=UPI000BE5C147|nr:glycosyltransferase [Mangrovitalea sediminis]
MKPIVSVIIPAKNEKEFIGRCLASINSQNYPTECLEIIVVDNSSTDETADIAKKTGALVIEGAKGYVGAVRNQGARKASGQFLAFIDADCIIDNDWVNRAVNLATAHPNHVFGGGCLIPREANWLEKNWLLGEGIKRVPKELIGASIFISKETFESIGGFNELLSSGEDTQLSVDLKSKGYSIKMTQELSVTHLGNAKTLRQFFMRQIWHSENYFNNLSASIKDPVFILISLHIFLFTLFLIGLITLSPSKLFAGLSGMFFIPAAFSFKRIYRSGVKKISKKQIFSIYFIDIIYVTARSCGLLLSLVGRRLNR